MTTQQLPPTTTHPLGLRPGGAAGAEQLAAIERLAAEVDASAAEGRLQEGVGGLLSRLAAEAARAGLDRFDEAAHTGLWRASTLLTAENRNAVGVAHATLDEVRQAESRR